MEALRIQGLITASIGVASLKKNIGGHGNARRIGDALIKAADTAMYLAKQNGKNRVVKARDVFTVT
ncbi:MAG: diguanylate cyclase [Deltaproteobacteria bacterium]|nr:diguanylate cyclase [Deltaproteobacteria bacterium]